MRIALSQFLADTDPARNLVTIEQRVHAAAERTADVVVFPEATMARFGIPLGGLAEPLDGPWASRVAELADAAGVLVVAGMFTPSGDGRVHNTLLLTGRGIHDRYDKVHLYDAFGFAESDTVAPGERGVTCVLDGLCFGVATCYDLRFPRLFTHLAGRGAKAILVPASWGAGPGKLDQWRLLVRARALDSTAWVLACGQADPSSVGVEASSKAPTGIGHSLVTTPTGTVHAEAGAEPELLVVDIDEQTVDTVRTTLPVLEGTRHFD